MIVDFFPSITYSTLDLLQEKNLGQTLSTRIRVALFYLSKKMVLLLTSHNLNSIVNHVHYRSVEEFQPFAESVRFSRSWGALEALLRLPCV